MLIDVNDFAFFNLLNILQQKCSGSPSHLISNHQIGLIV
ncbi:hypothetical protein MTBBW1_2500031 [Desulfamplus magnetovallimortis]|uniref:Uncharacterized protein n=1 Tax=Desulfamplus magnetovallimortis TaxID=1246637 RepID=A0A1W1HES9_9BACT|nr:hypothetical protein MTBBW1_2500031 [Desulfamplus magnetovallimortis]